MLYYIPAVVDTNALLGATDIMVSDYSSIFFDFLPTGKPILYYIDDLETYESERGLYFPATELPGPVTGDMGQLGKWVGDIGHYKDFFDAEKYEKARKKFACHEDGNASERVVQAVFYGDGTYARTCSNKKTKILLHTDDVRANGICSAARSLMNHMDFEKYDVSFYAIGASGQKDFMEPYLRDLDDRVRVLARVGARISNVETYALTESCLDSAVTEEDAELFPSEFYRLEYTRSFGDAKFDYIIDFSGLAAFWAYMYLSRKDVRKLIWMHNPMQREYDRMDDGETYTFRRSLDNVFKIYQKFDGCVSCSRMTMEENQRYFREKKIPMNFLYANNLFDGERVKRKSREGIFLEINGASWLLANYDDSKGTAVLVPVPSPDKTTFVTIGRMTDAKNTESLVRAFSRLHASHRETELFLIGAGPNEKRVREIVKEEGLEGSVVMTGNLDNPFPVMKACDCFVLPSIFEGQPMVIQEARTLGLPIIVSDFSTVKDSIQENGQLVIGTGIEDIRRGLEAFLERKVPKDYAPDIEEYNRAAMEEFEGCLEACREKSGKL